MGLDQKAQVALVRGCTDVEFFFFFLSGMGWFIMVWFNYYHYKLFVSVCQTIIN